MRSWTMLFVLFLFPGLAAASPFVGKWKLDNKKTYDFAVSQIKKNKTMSPRIKKRVLKMQKMTLVANVKFHIHKNNKTLSKVVLKLGNRKPWTKVTKGKWSKSKTGIEYTTEGRYPRKYTCIRLKKHLICSRGKGARKKSNFFVRAK